MEKLEIKGTRDTPEILFDPENNKFNIQGNSMPEDATAFFENVFSWVEKYVNAPLDDTIINCNLEYFNSTSAKMFYQIFIELEKIQENDKNVKISWYYEPGDRLIEEKGQEYKEVLQIPFELIENN